MNILLPLIITGITTTFSGPHPKHAPAEEAARAPSWPVVLHIADRQCGGSMEPADFANFLDTIPELNSYMHQDLLQVDLNGDGQCEYIAFQTLDCGIGGCAQHSIKVYNDKVLFLGGQPQYWHLHSESNGWLQLGAASSAGANVTVQRLYEYRDGHYRQVRQDRYVQGEDDVFRYDGTTTTQ